MEVKEKEEKMILMMKQSEEMDSERMKEWSGESGDKKKGQRMAVMMRRAKIKPVGAVGQPMVLRLTQEELELILGPG